uniref:Retrotransposon gag domain-containing protein n=1 Tax=Chromera velia CCMP2878 TaxID=1169474 RepID=A0A0G4ID90_9ALVE|eukprot:Cvel_101.t1-p1 / transcript=Cvel_101.t1 / gene=Cvel_101 / organism=Chromera_velia_CCMP2878 / gene_product=hypothetical protein / transcript_product=hypothetical protein / location=Cvel_scaffold8:76931-84732(-) / protein_length=369 / sequence_SO=supercontig / SO=protein_coding / is_pseudo=false
MSIPVRVVVCAAFLEAKSAPDCMVVYAGFCTTLPAAVHVFSSALPPVVLPRNPIVLKQPDEFTGHRDTVKRFITDTNDYFTNANVAPHRQLGLTKSFLCKELRDWFDLRVKRGMGFTDWPALREVLQRRYKEKHERRKARKQVLSLRYTGTVDDYNKEFSLLALKITNTSEEDLVEDYIEGLPPGIMYETDRIEPVTLDEAMEKALDSEIWLKQASSRSGSHHRPPPPPAPFNPTGPNHPQTGPGVSIQLDLFSHMTAAAHGLQDHPSPFLPSRLALPPMGMPAAPLGLAALVCQTEKNNQNAATRAAADAAAAADTCRAADTPNESEVAQHVLGARQTVSDRLFAPQTAAADLSNGVPPSLQPQASFS